MESIGVNTPPPSLPPSQTSLCFRPRLSSPLPPPPLSHHRHEHQQLNINDATRHGTRPATKPTTPPQYSCFSPGFHPPFGFCGASEQNVAKAAVEVIMSPLRKVVSRLGQSNVREIIASPCRRCVLDYPRLFRSETRNINIYTTRMG